MFITKTCPNGEMTMSYLDKADGKVTISNTWKERYNSVFMRDALIVDIMRGLGFKDNATRWKPMIVWTHKSGDVSISVESPQGKSWFQDPYADPQSETSFIHEQSYTMRLASGESAVVEPNESCTHWLTLTDQIRNLWENQS